MAVSRAEKTTELQELTAAFGQSQTAILIDYKGIKVPEVTELRRQVKAVKGTYKVVKNTLARRAISGTAFESLAPHFQGTVALAYSEADPVVAGQDADDVRQDDPGPEDQGRRRRRQGAQGHRGRRARDAAGQAGAVREAAVPAAGADGPARHGAERHAAGSA